MENKKEIKRKTTAKTKSAVKTAKPAVKAKTTRTSSKKSTKPAVKTKTTRTSPKKTTRTSVKKVEKPILKNIEENVPVVKDKPEADKRYLIVGILYLICGLIWIVGGACKLMVKESYVVDIILGIIWLGLSFIYFKRYNKDKK